MQTFGKRRRIVLENLFYAADDVQCGSGTGLIHAHEHAALPVGANDIGLRRKAVADVGDLAHVDGGAVHGFYRQVVQFLHGLGSAVEFHDVLDGAHLHRAGGQQKILRVDGVDDVVRGKPFGLERLRVEVHGDEPLFSAVWIGQGRALHGGQLGANEIVAEVKERLLAKVIAGQTDLNHRNGGRGIDGHERGSGSRRQGAQDGLHNGGGLREGGLNVGFGLEKDFDYGDAVERLRFDVLDVVDQRGHGPLGVGSDALLHLLGLQSGVVPDQADHRDVDVRENVRGRAQQDYRGKQNDDQGHDDEGVGPRKR